MRERERERELSSTSHYLMSHIAHCSTQVGKQCPRKRKLSYVFNGKESYDYYLTHSDLFPCYVPMTRPQRATDVHVATRTTRERILAGRLPHSKG
jgi:hypothetical protein